MDFIVASAIAAFASKKPTQPVTLSYDIICQWSIYLLQRLAEFPPHLQIELPEGELRLVIPKFHFNGHNEQGHNQYNLNLVRGVGRTDGEEPERGWARNQGTANSTREMGPGSRHDTLEDHFGYGNWQKYIGLGRASMLRIMFPLTSFQVLLCNESHAWQMRMLESIVMPSINSQPP